MRIRIILIAVAVMFAFCPLAFSKEWYQLYEDGKKAIDKNNCAEGEKDIKEALRKNPRSDLKARPYGTITREYIPHFYLAKCAVEKGDYAAADLYLGEAKKVDMYQSSKAAEFRTMVKTVEDKIKLVKGGGQTPALPPGTTTGTPTGTPTTGTNTGAPTTGTQPPIQGGTTTNIQSAQQVAINRALDNARSAYASGDYEEARSEANRVLMLDRNNREANRILTQISSKESAELSARAKQQKIEEVRRAMNRGDLTIAESTILQLRSEYPSDRTIESLATEIQQRRLAQMQSMTDANKRKESERQVVRAYFEGKYLAVVELADTYLPQHPGSWRLHFYKGCALAAMGYLDDKTKESQLSRAREAFRKARVANGQISRPVQISPKIWEIYKDS